MNSWLRLLVVVALMAAWVQGVPVAQEEEALYCPIEGSWIDTDEEHHLRVWRVKPSVPWKGSSATSRGKNADDKGAGKYRVMLQKGLLKLKGTGTTTAGHHLAIKIDTQHFKKAPHLLTFTCFGKDHLLFHDIPLGKNRMVPFVTILGKQQGEKREKS